MKQKHDLLSETAITRKDILKSLCHIFDKLIQRENIIATKNLCCHLIILVLFEFGSSKYCQFYQVQTVSEASDRLTELSISSM